MDLSRILADLQETSVYDVEFPEVPYSMDSSIEDKFKCMYKSLRRSINLKSRILSLVNAYYLGKLLYEMDSTKEHSQYKQKLTKHYATIAEYTFDLFEFCPDQILKTKWISVQDIRKFSRSTLLDLRTELVIFVRAQNLGEEIEDVQITSTN